MGVARYAAGLLLLAGLAAAGGCGSPAVTAESPESGREQSEFSKERNEFEGVVSRLRPFLSELRQVREDYANGTPAEQEVLRARYEEMLKQGAALEADLIDTAVLACVRHPLENVELAYFLSSVATTQLMQEEYEDAWKLAQKLVDNKVGDLPDDTSVFYSMCYCAAVAAYAANEFDIADALLKFLDEKQIRLAGKRNPMQEVVDRCRQSMEYHKKAWKREEEIREREKVAANLPRLLLKTTKGDIEVELFENEAPNTVANFVYLVEKRDEETGKGFYDGRDFFRVVPMNMAQAGCPKDNGVSGPGYTIRDECARPDRRLHFRGSLSMVPIAGPNTGGSQFEILFRPSPERDGRQTVFGRVVRGIEVLARLQRREPPDPMQEEFVEAPKADTIVEATVLSKRPHPYEPKVKPGNPPETIYDQIPEEYKTF